MHTLTNDSLRVAMVSDDFVQSHSGLILVSLPLTNGVVPKSLPESIGNPA
jgi:hypothetical protein